MNSLRSISNQEIVNQLKKLVSQEQNLTLQILPHLVEVERRGLYLEKAYSTLSEYCIHELGYGESSAWRRVRVARVIKEIPEVYDLLKDNKLSFSSVLQIANVLNQDNHKDLLPRVVGKSKSQIDKITVEYQAPQIIPDQARPRLVKTSHAVQRTGGPELGEISLRCEGENNPTVKHSTPGIIVEKMFEIRFAADQELMELIQWMKSHLSHKYPKGATFQEVFKYAIKYLKQREDFSVQDKPGKLNGKTNTRYIPKAIKQKVWKRDGGRCAFVGANGRRCNSDYNLQYDHYPAPFARGGKSTVENLRLLCAKHNNHTAKKTFGEATITKHYIKEPPAVYIPGLKPPDGRWARNNWFY